MRIKTFDYWRKHLNDHFWCWISLSQFCPHSDRCLLPDHAEQWNNWTITHKEYEGTLQQIHEDVALSFDANVLSMRSLALVLELVALEWFLLSTLPPFLAHCVIKSNQGCLITITTPAQINGNSLEDLEDHLANVIYRHLISIHMMTSSNGNIFRVTGPCITNVIATCRKNFSQWERSFLWKLRCHWLKFLRRVAKTLVIQGPGHLCGEFTGPRWIPRAKASDAGLWCFLWSASE